MIADNGPIVVLNPKYAIEIRDDDRLSLSKFTAGGGRASLDLSFKDVSVIDNQVVGSSTQIID